MQSISVFSLSFPSYFLFLFFLRKGGATYALSFPGGPSAVAVYLRAAWSLGPTQCRYVFAGDGGDQFVGRVLAGLPINSIDFAILPPRFDSGFVVSSDELCQFLVNYSRFPNCFRPCLPFLVASLSYHHRWLDENLASTHPLRLSPIWTSGYLTAVKPHVVCEVGSSNDNLLQATGVPLVISTSLHVANLSNALNDLKSAVSNHFDELNGKLAAFSESIPSTVSKELLATFKIEGANPITESFIEDRIHLSENRLRERLDAIVSLINTVSLVSSTHQSTSSNGETSTLTSVATFQRNWGGRLWNPVPEGFRFPKKTTVKQMWDLWYKGFPSEGHSPYRQLKPTFHLDRRDFQYHSRACRVMKALSYLVIDNVGIAELSSLSKLISASNEILDIAFQQSFVLLMSKIDEADVAHRSQLLSASTMGLNGEGTTNCQRIAKKRRFEDRNIGSLTYTTVWDDLNKFSFDGEWQL